MEAPKDLCKVTDNKREMTKKAGQAFNSNQPLRVDRLLWAFQFLYAVQEWGSQVLIIIDYKKGYSHTQRMLQRQRDS